MVSFLRGLQFKPAKDVWDVTVHMLWLIAARKARTDTPEFSSLYRLQQQLLES